jgi:hypothetical protein
MSYLQLQYAFIINVNIIWSINDDEEAVQYLCEELVPLV